MFEEAWDQGLDDAQLSAVTHGSSPLVVVAGAGTGKTRTLTGRVAYLLERGVRAERVLLLTFTRRAADEMVARAAALCRDRDAARRIWGGTFHAIAHRLLAEHAGALGLEHVTVIDPADVADLLDLLRDEHGLGAVPGGQRMPRASTLADIYSRAVNTGRPARDVISADFPWCEPHVDAINGLLQEFTARKRTGGLLDFDDLLLGWRALLTDPMLRERLVGRWDHVLVDEYQDVNAVQVDIISALRPGGAGLTVVGDDAQAVYGFRGATSGHLLRAARSFDGAQVVRLDRNFRSRQPLLDLANVIRPGGDDLPLVLHADRLDPESSRSGRSALVRCYDAGEEARLVADAVLDSVEQGGRLRDHAVLMRSGHHSDLLEVELTARRIPFVKYGGLKFLEAAHVKDFLAVLRLIGNPVDEIAWFRLLRLHDGIGPARARALLPLAMNLPGPGPGPGPGPATGRQQPGGGGAAAEDPAPAVNAMAAAAPARTRTRLAATMLALIAAREVNGVDARVEQCLNLLRPLIVQRYPDAGARLGDIDRLAAAAAGTEEISTFVAQLTLDPPASTGDYAKPPHLDEDYLTLSTVHSAKGLEWPAVHVIHAVDGAFPSDMALSTPQGLEEEQRLFYVAVTRARDALSVYTPLRMPHHRHAADDRHSFAPACRFLDERARATMRVVEPARPSRPKPVAAPGTARVELPALDSLFG